MANYRYCVYCHTNKINGKQYIGRTHLNPLNRWGKEGEGYKNHPSFYSDIQQYGWDNFTHEILEYGIVGKEIADQKEREYIKQLNSVYPNGYNKEDGGVHGSTNPHDKKEKRPLKGWHHSDETIEKIRQGIKASDTHPLSQRIKKSKPVDMLDKDGKYIKSFYGIAEAGAQTGINPQVISMVCNDTKGRFKTAGGYKWRFSQKGA